MDCRKLYGILIFYYIDIIIFKNAYIECYKKLGNDILIF